MAKIRIGALAGQISGPIGALSFGTNRGGAYVRNRSLTTTKTSQYALAAKNRFSLHSSAWADLSEAQRLSWSYYAATYPTTDSFGQKRIPTGQQCYVSINSRLSAAGFPTITNPSPTPTPPSLLSLDIAFDPILDPLLVFTASPLNPSCVLWITACPLRHATTNFIENRLKFIGVSPTGQASGYAFVSQFLSRFSYPAIGNKIEFSVSVLDTTSGLLSLPRRVSVIVQD